MDIIKELRAFIGGAVLVVFALPALYLTQGYQPVIRLIIVVIAGVIGYIWSIWFIERDSLIKALQMIGIKGVTEKAGEPD